MNIKDRNEYGVSPVVGIAVLIAIAVILSALVFATTSGFMTEQQAPSAGANVNIVSESVIQVQLDSVQNADNVYVQSPLGTRYKFDGIGDTVEILNIGNKQKPVVIAEKDGKETVVQGITPRSFDADYVVREGGLTLSDALSKADSTENETIVIKRGEYSGDVDITKKSKIIAEHGTTINGTVTVSESVTFSNAEIVGGSINVDSNGVYLASTTGSIDATGYENDVVIAEATNSLIQEVDNTTSTQTTVSNVAPSADFTFSPTSPVTGESVSFDGSASADEDGSIESYEWDFDGDGNTDATGEVVNYTFSNASTYNAELTVTDNDGGEDSVTQTITINKSTSEGLIARYEFEGDATDSVGNYNASDHTSAGFGTGIVGSKSNKFDGNDDYMTMPSSLWENGNMTITTWWKTTEIGDKQPYLYALGNSHMSFSINNSSTGYTLNTLVVSTENGSSRVDTTKADDGKWHFAAIVNDKSTGDLVLYVDGNEVVRNSGAASSADSFSNVYVGRLSPTVSYPKWYGGEMDETRVYDRVLTKNEIQSLYEDGNYNPEPDFTYSPQSPGPGELVSFDASNSSDSDGTIETYSWDLDGDGQEDATGENVQHSFSSKGQKEVTLTVTDNSGDSESLTRTVDVTDIVISNGLDAYYTFDGTLDDEVNSRSASAVNSSSPTYTSQAVSGQAVSFDGTWQIDTKENIDSSTFSVSTWFKPEGGGYIFCQSPTSGTYDACVSFKSDNNNVEAIYGGGGYDVISSPNGTIDPNSYNHIVLTHNQSTGTAKLYVNNSVVGTGPANTWSQSSSTMRVGAIRNWAHSNANVTGDVDQFKIYNRELSATEVGEMYNAGS